MPENRIPRTPKLCHHKPTNQAYARADGQTVYFGLWNSAKAAAGYAKFLSDWVANGRRVPLAVEHITVAELAERYYLWAKTYYTDVDKVPTSESNTIMYALRAWRSLHGTMPVAEFGPSHLRTLQEHMVKPLDPARSRMETKPAPWHPEYGLGWARSNANAQIRRIVRCLKWGVEHELIPGAVHQACATLSPLRKGRSAARETEPVRPCID